MEHANVNDLEPDSGECHRLDVEVIDTQRRVVIGGTFYLLGWLLVCLFTPVVGRYLIASLLIAASFVGLAVARMAIKPPPAASRRRRLHWLDVQWGIIQASAGLWGAIVLWTLIDPLLTPVRMALLIGTAGFATAIAHTYCMRFWAALVAIVVMYLPSMMLMWIPGNDHAVAFTLTVYFVYVLTSLVRSHRDYHQRLDCDQALLQQRDRFAWMSRTDVLTQLANRRHFVDAMEAAIQQARHTVIPLALLVLDIDFFKQINDSHGHRIGDRCLASFGDQMRHVFAGQGELCARLGGEEFAVLLPNHDEAQAAARADAFRIGLSAATVVPELPELRMRVSIGVGAFCAEAHADADQFFGDVDRALYRAKAEGRNCVCRVAVCE
jgi:diguanylate cyclase (GGDEF)-like protein